MADQWYYNSGGQHQGPLSAGELKQLAASGRLAPTDLVWKEGMSAWMPASKIKGLFPDSPSSVAVTASSQSSPPSNQDEPIDVERSAIIETPREREENSGWILIAGCYGLLWITLVVYCVAILMPNIGLFIAFAVLSLGLEVLTLIVSLYTFAASASWMKKNNSSLAVAGFICSTFVAICCTLALMFSCIVGTMAVKGLDILHGGPGPFRGR